MHFKQKPWKSDWVYDVNERNIIPIYQEKRCSLNESFFFFFIFFQLSDHLFWASCHFIASLMKMDKFLRENHNLIINKMYIYSNSQDSAILLNTFTQSLATTPLSIRLQQLNSEIFCVVKSLNISLEQQLRVSIFQYYQILCVFISPRSGLINLHLSSMWTCLSR